MLQNGHLLAVDKNHGVIELDRDGDLVWEYATPAHHDVARREDGGTYLLSGRDRVAPAMKADQALFYDCLLEVSAGGEVTWSWYAEEHAAELGVATPLPADYPFADWPHLNTCEALPDSPTADRDGRFRAGNLLMCGRIIHTIFVVDRETGGVVWHWGLGDLIGPHMPTMLANGNLLIYDNGSLRDRSRGFTRVVELDPLRKEIVWEYRADPPESFYSPSRGSAERLSNGNHLIAESDSGRLFEVAPDGEIVWELINDVVLDDGRRDPIYRVKPYAPELVAALF
jgi:outer membrane protein assembly factor BamB